MERLREQLVVSPHAALTVARKHHRRLDLLEEIAEGRVDVRFTRHFLASQTIVERGDERAALERREDLHVTSRSQRHLATRVLAAQQLRLQLHEGAGDRQFHAIVDTRELQSVFAEVAAEQTVRFAAAEERARGVDEGTREERRRLRETGLVGGTLGGERAGVAAGADGAVLANALRERRREALRPDSPEKRAGDRSRSPSRDNGSWR